MRDDKCAADLFLYFISTCATRARHTLTVNFFARNCETQSKHNENAVKTQWEHSGNTKFTQFTVASEKFTMASDRVVECLPIRTRACLRLLSYEAGRSACVYSSRMHYIIIRIGLKNRKMHNYA